MGDVVRADYDQLKEVSQKFREQAEKIKATGQGLQRMADGLQREWVGLGAKQFQQEMQSSVYPEFGRLTNALDTAGQIMDKISKLFQDAEQEASNTVTIKITIE